MTPPNFGASELPQFPCRKQEFERPLSPLPSRSAASVSPRSLGTVAEGLQASGPRGFLPFSGSCKHAPAAQKEKRGRGDWGLGVGAPIRLGCGAPDVMRCASSPHRVHWRLEKPGPAAVASREICVSWAGTCPVEEGHP